MRYASTTKRCPNHLLGSATYNRVDVNPRAKLLGIFWEKQNKRNGNVKDLENILIKFTTDRRTTKKTNQKKKREVKIQFLDKETFRAYQFDELVVGLDQEVDLALATTIFDRNIRTARQLDKD